MELDMELKKVQEKLYITEKALLKKKEDIRFLESAIQELQEQELALLQEHKQPVRAGPILVTAVRQEQESMALQEQEEQGNMEYSQLSGLAGEEDGDLPRSSTLVPGGERTDLQFSQAMSDIEPVDVKMTRSEAFKVQKDMKGVTEAAEQIIKNTFGIEVLDLTQDEKEQFQSAVETVRRRLNKLKAERKKNRKGVERPDQTFLKCSEFEGLQMRVKQKKELEDDTEEIEDQEDMDSVDFEEDFDEEEDILKLRKGFTELVPLSKGQKKRAKPLLEQIRRWCDVNSCEVVKALGFIIHTEYYPKKLANLGLQLFLHGSEVIFRQEVPNLAALWLGERLHLGRGGYTDTRLLLLR
jgi:hypothetical protein